MPDDANDPTVKDILEGLERVEEWLRQMRHALAALPPDQRLTSQVIPQKAPQLVRPEACG